MRIPWGSSAVGNVLSGAVLGLVLAGLVAVAVWPDSSTSGAAAANGADSEIPTVPPPRSVPEPEPEPEPEVESAEEDPVDDEEGEPSDAPTIADAPAAGTGPLPESSPVTCPAATVEVADAEELQQALDRAEAGDTIALADGQYAGRFLAEASGTAAAPIFLCGSADAVLDGGDPEEDGYTFHLDAAKYWRLVGFTVTGGQKGVMADGTVGSVVQGLTVTGTGDEAIHLRSFSTDNVVLDNHISDTGLRNEKYGEGVYIGTAVSNWCSYTDCEADRSDRNVVKGNTIVATTSEPIDIKEGTTGGALLDNIFDGAAMTDADTWVNLKGNNYLVQGNRGTSASDNGFETHDILPGWGDFNVFDHNSGVVGGSGWGIASWPEGSNVVLCSNDLTDAAEGLSNIPCT
jgi:hypothetical protein